VLSIAGDHVPVIPLFDVVGKALIVAPEQNGPTAENVGVIFGVMVNCPLRYIFPSQIPPPDGLNPPYCHPHPFI
jgi:hypothetical protein